MKILGLDLGTKTGYAYNDEENRIRAGTWVLATPKEVTQWGKERQTRTRDPRVERLCERLSSLPIFDIVVFEDVQFASYTKQVQLWSALRSAVWLCGKSKIFECVDVKKLKVWATGNGNADKDKMRHFLERRHPAQYHSSFDDNAVDAIWLYLWANINLARTKI